MIKNCFIRTFLPFVCLLFAVPAFLLFCSYIQAPKIINLRDEPITFTPTEFYIDDVVDEREDRSAVAWLMGITSDHKSEIKKVDIQGGLKNAMKNFYDHNLSRNKSLRPVVINIKDFKITESTGIKGSVEGKLTVVFSYFLKDEIGNIHLIDYHGGMRYLRPVEKFDVIEPALRNILTNSLSYFNKWIITQANSNLKLAKGVKVAFADYKEKVEGDTIYYSAKRPLVWADFKGKPNGGKFDAEIFPGVGYTESAEVIKGIVNLHIQMKVYVPKSACWVKDGSISAHTLNHEQRHFDIAKLASEHFKQKILKEQLPVRNFDGPINVEYLELLRDAHTLQKQYDTETRHGSDQAEQERWNQRIDKELHEFGIK